MSSEQGLESRFKQKYFVDESGCWIWTGAITSQGYGCFWLDSRVRSSHIVSYEMHVGQVPEGLELDHTCSTTNCVNPTHLEPVTHAENLKRAFQRKPKDPRLVCKNNHDLTSPEHLAIWGGKRYCRTCVYRRKRESDSRRKSNV